METSSLERVLKFVLSPPASAARGFTSIDDWWPQFRAQRQNWEAPIDQALIGGAIADRIGYAFAAGYQAALRRMDPGLPQDRMACFSVTEEGGGHPRAVQATLQLQSDGSYRLSGKKKWATLSSTGGIALVVASIGSHEGKNRLRVARVDLASSGVTVIAMPPTPFSPEVPHRRLEFENVAVGADQLLPGDGYDAYVKPFRTHEDTHVSGAILAYLSSIAARFEWPRSVREELLQLIISLRALAFADPTAAVVHVGLEGVFRARHHLLERCAPLWEQVESDERERWQRDAALSNIAGNVRAQRAEKAWQMLADH